MNNIQVDVHGDNLFKKNLLKQRLQRGMQCQTKTNNTYNYSQIQSKNWSNVDNSNALLSRISRELPRVISPADFHLAHLRNDLIGRPPLLVEPARVDLHIPLDPSAGLTAI